MKRYILVLALLLAAPGCARYYRIVDVETKQKYYAREVYVHDLGSTQFRNARNGSEVTLRAADVERIPKEEFDRAVGSR